MLPAHVNKLKNIEVTEMLQEQFLVSAFDDDNYAEARHLLSQHAGSQQTLRLNGELQADKFRQRWS